MEYGQNPYFIRIIPFHFYHRYHKHGLEGKPSHGSGRIRLSSGRQKCGQYDYVSAGQGCSKEAKKKSAYLVAK